MTYNPRSQHPARAVCYHAPSMGPDGDGGVTAGPPLAGGGAASSLRFNSRGQSSEIPFRGGNNRRPPRTNSKPTMYSPSRSPSRPPPASRSSGVGSTIGYVPLPPEGEDAAPPPIKLKPRLFAIGTWNINGFTGRNGPLSS